VLASNAALVTDFLSELERQLYSLQTLSGYRRDLSVLVELSKDQPLEGLSTQSLRAALASAAQRGLSARSIRRRLSAWRGFYQWRLHSQGIAQDPTQGLRAPRASRPLPKSLSVDQAIGFVSQSADQSDQSALLEARDLAMLELLYSSGLRLSEMLGLNLAPSRGGLHGWLDLENAEVTVVGKGGKTRTVPLGQPASRAIKSWLLHRGSLNPKHLASPPSDAAVFVNLRGERLSPRTVQRRFAQRARDLGLGQTVHPHMLRHSFASHLLQSSGDLRAVQELLGHAQISTTQIYTHLDFAQLAKVYDAAHPRARRNGEAK
jgi:integrase/recombinase XerC